MVSKSKGTLRDSVDKRGLVQKRLEQKMADTKTNIIYKRLNCDLPEDLFYDLKKKSAEEKTTMKNIVIRLVGEYLKK